MAWPATLWLVTELPSQARKRASASRDLISSGGSSASDFVVGIAEPPGDVGDRGRVERQRAVLDRLPFLLDLARESLRAEVDQDLDARLVDVVAPAILIVGAQDRLDVAQKLAFRQERIDGLADERGPPEPAADDHLEAGLVGIVAVSNTLNEKTQ